MAGRAPAFQGLALVFALTFVNLVGVIVTAAALGGIEPWNRWQFIGLFGALEAGSGLANVLTPNLWRLPAAQLQVGERSKVRLGAALLVPHWGGLARSAAGAACLGVAAWHEGVGPVTLGLLPLLAAIACIVLALSALLARAGVARPDTDVVQFVIRWRGRERQTTPLSIGASALQLVLSIATIPAVKLLPPSVLYQPELGPSAAALGAAAVTALVLLALVALVWSGHIRKVHGASRAGLASESLPRAGR
ncbi:MAG TPA: hypothetical protein VFU10_04480 [Gaiellaceae bacterium]|nr:hypothetical protein [Gaiellaceae bacterium]